ncbi:hypothetical protein ACHWQZ_G011945 [Mnemiopsis leidyi]
MGFQSELHFGALYVRSIEGFLMWMAACSVSSKWDLDGRVLRMLMPFQVPGYSVSSGEGVKNRAMTKEVMAKLLSTAFSIVKSQETVIQNLETNLEEYYCELSDAAAENKKLKSECALEVVDLQRDVVKLQRELLSEKEKQLSDLRATVVASVEDTVKAEFKSYSSVVQKTQPPSPVIAPSTLKSVVRTVVEEGDRSRSVMVFGLEENKDEKLRDMVTRIGSSTRKTRPVKVTIGSSVIAREILRKSKQLKNTAKFKTVYISPDRTIEQREEHKTLVLELKRRQADEPNKRHYIKGNCVCSVEK